MGRMPIAICASLLISGAFAATCREHGCTKYANPNGWCEIHQSQGRAYRAKKAAEAAADREIIRNHNSLVRQHDAEDAAVKAAEERKMQRLEAEHRKQSKIEQGKFEQPLEGLFGKAFGEPASEGESAFVPTEPFRCFSGYAVRSEGTNGVVRISAYADFASKEAARRECDAVLADLASRYGRVPNKIFTKEGDDVRALGFGGVDGMAHQQLQVSLAEREKLWRIDLVAFVIRRPQRVIVSEAEQEN